MVSANNQIPDPDDLDPPLKRQAVGSEILNGRKAFAAAEQAELERFQVKLDKHCQCYLSIVEEASKAHASIMDEFSIPLEESTRWSAVIIMGGKSIALANAYLTLLSAGYGAESVPIARTLHESLRLLDTFVASGFVFSEEIPASIREAEQLRWSECDRLLRKWLRDEGSKYVRPSEARKASHQSVEVATGLAEHVGAEAYEPSAVDLAGTVYDLMSKVSHNRRCGLVDCYSDSLRAFSYGPHFHVRNRRVNVLYAGQLLEDFLFSMQGMLLLFGKEEWIQVSKRLGESIDDIRKKYQLEI